MKGSPYVGPRPYERGDQKNFYGREREARELQALLTAEREVLVYAASGAGKTSLFNARVIPALEEQGFLVLPVARVGMDLPPGIQPGEVKNVYIFSTLLSLAGDEVDPRSMLDDELAGYVQSLLSAQAVKAAPEIAVPEAAVGGAPAAEELPVGPGLSGLEEVHPPILIFDQFEELFTSHRERWEEARGFFDQVRALMDAVPGLGVVFSMREDHVAALDPFLPVFPNRLRARFRLEPLGQSGALAAIARPAKNAGIPFADGVAERLVDDLRMIKVQATGKEEENALGPFVEPVHLQVVCAQLWAHLPESKTGEIQWEEVQQYGNVDRALTSFYDTCVLRAAARLGGMEIPLDVPIEPGMPGLMIAPAHERRVRTWVGSQLITSVDTRGLALRGPEETAGMPNEIVDVLEDQHLIRAEVRAGARWYELAHDRLVDPILTSNRAWEKSRETPLRTAARRWKETGDASLLYRGNALDEVKEMIKIQEERPVMGFDFEPFEYEFYEASLKAEQAARRRRRQAVATVIGILALLALMIALTLFAFTSRSEAERQKATALVLQVEAYAQRGLAQTAQAKAEEGQKQVEAQNAQIEKQKEDADKSALLSRGRELASYASSVLQQGQPQRAMLLAMQGLQRYQQGGGERFVVGEQVLRDALNETTGVPLRGQGTKLYSLVPSPDGKWLAAEGEKNIIYVWDVSNGDPGVPFVLQPEWSTPPAVNTESLLAFSLDSRWLVYSKGTANSAWDMKYREANPISYTSNHFLNPRFLSGGRWLLTGGHYDPLVLWDLRKGGPFQSSRPVVQDVDDAIVDPTGKWLLGTYNRSDFYINQADLWSLQDDGPQTMNLDIPLMDGLLRSAAFSADGRWMVFALSNNTNGFRLRFYDLTTPNPLEKYVEVPLDKDFQEFTMHFHSKTGWLVTEAGLSTEGPLSVSVDIWDLRNGVSADMRPARTYESSVVYTTDEFSSADGCWMMLKTGDSLHLLRFSPNGPLEEISPKGVSFSHLQFSFPGKYGLVRYLAMDTSGREVYLMDLNPQGDLQPDCSRSGDANPANQNLAPEVATLPLGGLNADVYSMAFLPGDRLAVLDGSQDARMWQLPVKSLSSSPEVLLTGMKDFSPLDAHFFITLDHHYLVLITNYGEVFRWPVDGSKVGPPERFPARNYGGLHSYEVSPDGRWLGMLLTTGRLYNYPLTAAGPAYKSQPSLIIDSSATEDSIFYQPFAYGPDGSWLVYRPRNGVQKLIRVDLDVNGAPTSQREFFDLGPQHSFIDVTANSRWMAALVSTKGGSDEDYQLYFWDLQNPGAAPMSFPAPRAGIQLQFSQDGGFLFAHRRHSYNIPIPKESNSRPPVIWDVRGLQPGQAKLPTVTLERLEGNPFDSALSPDGRWLLTNLDESSGVVLWSLETLRRLWDADPVAELYSTTLLSEGSATNFTFSANGRWMAALGTNQVYLWDLKDIGQGAVVLRPPALSRLNITLAFLPDSSAVIAMDDTGAMLRWPTDVNELVPMACSLVGRDLTAAEQQQYLQGETPLKVCGP